MTIDLHLAPWLRMSGAILLLHLYVFMTWIGTTGPSAYFVSNAKESTAEETSRRVGSFGMSVNGFVYTHTHTHTHSV